MLSPHETLRKLVADELAEHPAQRMPDQYIQRIARAADVCQAAENLLEDIHRRHPDEELTCPFIIALEKALMCV